MASITTKKREVVDFLWDWAKSKSDWANLLVSIITNEERKLGSEERNKIFSYFLNSIGIGEKLPQLSLVKPNYNYSVNNIKLTSLSNVSGVNKLAPNQVINFAENLTVVYGENGTGKTGYSRILKSLGFSYDTQNNILSDIFSEKQKAEASIKYTINNDSKEILWNPSKQNVDLNHISIFNTNCVNISLSDRQLIVSPIGFHLFNLISSELMELQTLLEVEKNKYSTEVLWKEKLHENTPQYNFINNISSNSDKILLSQISSFTESDSIKLSNTEKEMNELNIGLLEKKISTIIQYLRELAEIKGKIQNGSELLSNENLGKLEELNALIEKLEKITVTGIKEIAEEHKIDLYETTQFKSFLQAAEDYIKELADDKYPDSKDVCIYCRQPLNQKAIDLLKSYRILLNDTTQSDLKTAKQQKDALLKKISQIEPNIKFHFPIFGTDDKDNPVQPSEMIQYNNSIENIISLISESKLDTKIKIDFNKYIQFISEKYTELENELDNLKATSRSIEKRREELNNIVAELQDRELLSSKLEAVLKIIENYRIRKLLVEKSSDFNTNAISRKTTEARDELVKANFKESFLSELGNFRKHNIKIDLNFSTEKGTSKISQRINTYLLSDILSEGEQKAISLAEFLAEIQLDSSIAPVVFDDPVNSLDHHIIDDVAKRLLLLSKKRQVIIFTHSILLFNSIFYYIHQPDYSRINYKLYSSSNNFGKTGFIDEAEEEIGSIKKYLSKINKILCNTSHDVKKESDIAADGYGDLRSAIELFIEYEVLQGTVKRYQKNVALSLFIKIDGTKINETKSKINDIFERCCGYISGHSNPTIVQNSPTIQELRKDFDDFNTIRRQFNTKDITTA